MNIIDIDIETLPNEAVREEFIESVVVRAPSSYNKPDFINDLKLGDQGKYKTVAELSAMWVEEFGAEQKQAQGDEQWRKTALDGWQGNICVIGFGFSGQEIQSVSVNDFESEAHMLQSFFSQVSDEIGVRQFMFAAHNAKFDLPFIWKRCVINKVKPLHFNHNGRHGQHYFCTMEEAAGFGGRISLDNLAKALGVKGKGDMDGSKVYDTWKADPLKVIDYCKDDVRVLREVRHRLMFEV